MAKSLAELRREAHVWPSGTQPCPRDTKRGPCFACDLADRSEELERERDAARRHAHRWWGTGDVCQCCGEKYPLSMKEPR